MGTRRDGGVRTLLARKLRGLARRLDPTAGEVSIAERSCPICGHSGRFRPAGLTRRPDAVCPNCGALERHRLMKLAMDRLALLENRPRTLHFSPEKQISGFVKPLCPRYVTADLFRDDVDLKLNIEALDLTEGEFDLVICSHVLEHVDDRKALAEINRVLAPDGVAVLAVPFVETWNHSFEDPSIVSPEDRQLHYGQADHLRIHGRDFRDRVRDAGFAVQDFVAFGRDVATYALGRGDIVFIARKREGAA